MKIGKNIRKTHKIASADEIRRRTDKLSAEKSRFIAACGSTLLKMFIQNNKTFKCSELLRTKKTNIDVDIFIVGFQEVNSRVDSLLQDVFIDGEDPWTNSVKKELAQYNYVKILSKRYFGAVLSVFCLRKHLIHLKNMEVQYTSFVEDMSLYGNTLLIGKSGALVGCHRCLTYSQTSEYRATQLVSSIKHKLSHAIVTDIYYDGILYYNLHQSRFGGIIYSTQAQTKW